jgi:hypothetical protein
MFRKDVERFLKKAADSEVLGRSLHFKPIHAAGSYAKYLTKGIAPGYADYFRMECLDQGFIAGRGRTFVSRSIGFAARKKIGWKRKRRPGSESVRLRSPSRQV